MHNLRVFILCIFIVILAAAIAGAVGKQTVDPNTGKPVTVSAANQDDAGSTWDSDQRLTKAITYSAHRRMLYQILDDLDKQSGVTFSTGRNGTDWRTRELRMNLAVKDVPLRDLMMSIARVMKLKWIRSAMDGNATYRLVGEKPPAPEETPEEKAARELAQRRRDFFNQYMGLARITTSELNRLQYSNPSLYAIAKTPTGIPLAKLLANSPAASMALMEGRELLLRGNDLPLSAANELMPAIQASPTGAAVQAPGKPMTLPRGIPASTDTLSVDINPTTGAGSGAGLGDIKISYNGRVVPITFADPNPVSATAIPATPASTPTAKAKPVPSPEPIVQHPDEPDLHKKIKLELKDDSATLGEFQAALANASGFSVISDSFYWFGKVIVPKEELELKSSLQIFVDAFWQNWDKRGRIIEMRDRDWAAKRELMIPESTLRKWRNALSSDGKLPDDVLKEIRALTSEQFNAYVNADNGLAAVAAAVDKATVLVP